MNPFLGSSIFTFIVEIADIRTQFTSIQTKKESVSIQMLTQYE